MAWREALKTQEVDQLISIPIAVGQPGTMSYWCFLLSHSAVTHIDPITAPVSMLHASAPALACLILLLLLVRLKTLLG